MLEFYLDSFLLHFSQVCIFERVLVPSAYNSASEQLCKKMQKD